MNEKMFERIEDYINGSMSPEEEQLFETEMATNEELSSAFSIYNAIETNMRNNQKLSEEAAALKITLDKIKSAYFKTETAPDKPIIKADSSKLAESHVAEQANIKKTESPGKIKRMNRGARLLVAAAIFGILALSITWLLHNNKSDRRIVSGDKTIDSSIAMSNSKIDTSANTIYPDSSLQSSNKNFRNIATDKTRNLKKMKALFAGNFKPDAAPDNKEGLLQEPLTLYADKNYKEAIETFEMAKEALETRGNNNSDTGLTSFNTHYYLALSYLASNTGIANAISNLKSAISNNPDSFLQTKAEWYLALAYLKAIDAKKAEQLLKKIIVNQYAGEYRQKAIHLLQDLNKNRGK